MEFGWSEEQRQLREEMVKTQASASSAVGATLRQGPDARAISDPSDRKNETPELAQSEIAEIEERLRYLGYID